MLQRPLWQKLVIAAVAVIGDFMVVAARFSETDGSSGRLFILFGVMIGTWILLPLLSGMLRGSVTRAARSPARAVRW